MITRLITRRTVLATALALGVGSWGVGSWVGVAVAADPVKIGAIEALSGPAGKYGTMIRAGFELALGEINAAGDTLPGRKIELIVDDSAGQKEQAINVAKKLIARDKVSLLLGPTLSNEMFAAGPVANERQIPIIGTSTTAKGITDIGEWVFRTSLPEGDVIPVTVRTAKEKFGVKRVALMYSNDDAFTKSGFDVFKDTAEKQGLEVATIETFSTKDTDFSAQLTKIKSLNVDAILVSALAEAGAGLILQARQLGIPKTVPILGGNGFNSPKVAEIAGEAAEGLIVGSPWFIGKADPVNQKFVDAFRAKNNQDPDQFAAQAYDTMYIVAAALTRAGSTDNKALREALLKTENTGVMGPFSFAPSRDPASTQGVVVLTIKGGKFTVLQ